MKLILAIALGLLLGGSGLALAQVGPASDGGRFAITPVEGGVLRVDRVTGVTSFCSQKEGEWSCRRVSDDQSQYGSLDGQGLAKPDDMGEGGLMTKQEVDQAVDSLEYLMDRIIGATERLQEYRSQPR